MTDLTQLPAEINIEAVVRDSFSSLVDFDIDLTGYTVTAYVDPVDGGTQTAFTIVETDLSAGQVTISLTAAQVTTIGEGTHKWYLKWVVGVTTIRTAFAGNFKITKYGV